MSTSRTLTTLLLMGIALPAATPAQGPTSEATPASPFTYPAARKGDQVDDYHGTKIADPYRWLEDADAPETRTWIDAQVKLTDGYLASIPQRASLRARLEQLWNYEKYDVPVKRGGRYFFSYNPGLANQAILYVQDGPSATARVLLDPNQLSADGTVAVGSRVPSPEGKYLAYGISSAGSDWVEFRVRDAQSAQDLADTIKWVKFSSPAWLKNETGFLYARYDEPSKDKALSQVVKNQKLYFHRIGTSQSSDKLVYERPDRPDWLWDAEVTDDGRYLIITVSQGTERKNRIFYKDLGDGAEPNFDAPVVEFLAAGDAEYSFIGNIGHIFYLRTDNGAPRGRIIAIDIANTDPSSWHTVIPESKDVLRGAGFIAKRLFVTALRDAHSVVYAMTLPAEAKVSAKFGKAVDVTLPGLGSLSGLSGKQDDTEVFYGFMSYLAPNTVYRYNVESNTSTVFRAPTLQFNPGDYETKQIFYTSKDGTKVPMFITMKKGTVLDGNNPTLLYGYGGFNISLTPAFNPRTIVWLEQGGIYAVANLRGGGEYGAEWHQSGTLLQKQNVFDDFIAAAEYLIANKYTSTPKLAINGGSNGGLLVGATLNQRPDLFGAAIPEVGVMDMLRFQKFTIGWAWVSDYGSSENPGQFAALSKYSPLHNIKPGTKYPPVLVMTADHDDRVVPGHSFKYAAALQAAQGGPAPTLIRIETKAGHGAGKPTSKQIDEAADRFAFLVKALGM